MHIVNRVRAIIVYDGKMLAVKHSSNVPHYCLPGGHLEVGESLEEGMKRELLEELGIVADIGQLLAVYEFIWPEKEVHSIEFFFAVKNPQAFTDIDNSLASHAHELQEFKFIDINSTEEKILPVFSRDIARDLLKLGEGAVPLKIYRGNN